jgi:acyl carrier protein
VSTGALDDRIRRWVALEAALPTAADTDVASVHERPEIDVAFVKPRTAAEHTIADVWGAVLGVASVGVHDNFFHLGGHSLLAIQLISRLRELFQAEIALTALFERPTVAELAAHIDLITGDANKRVEQLEEMLDYIERLSPDEVQALLDSPPPD